MPSHSDLDLQRLAFAWRLRSRLRGDLDLASSLGLLEASRSPGSGRVRSRAFSSMRSKSLEKREKLDLFELPYKKVPNPMVEGARPHAVVLLVAMAWRGRILESPVRPA